jgi:hypothetical protein
LIPAIHDGLGRRDHTRQFRFDVDRAVERRLPTGLLTIANGKSVSVSILTFCPFLALAPTEVSSVRRLTIVPFFILAACTQDTSQTDLHVEPIPLPNAATSYALTFAEVDFLDDGWHPAASPQSQDLVARLDLRPNAGGYDAVFTAPWGDPTPFQVTVEASRLVLKGRVTLGRDEYDYSDVADSWQEIVLERFGDMLRGAFTATGTEEHWSGDTWGRSPLAGKGVIGFDATRPTFRPEPASRLGPVGKVLPWDPLPVRASEGIVGLAHTLSTAGDATTEWTPNGEEPLGNWGGSVVAVGRLTNWNVTGPLQVLVGQAPTDPAGNLVDLGDLRFDVLSVGGPVADLSLDGTTPGSPTTWGDVKLVADATVTGGAIDPHCEQGGCAQIGPFHSVVCNDDRTGLAVRLNTDGATSIAMRYRVLLGESSEFPPETYGVAQPFAYEVAAPGVVASGGGVELGDLHYEESPPVPGYRWSTVWETLHVPLVTSSPEHAFAVRAGERPSGMTCTGLPGYRVDMVVLVDSITVER